MSIEIRRYDESVAPAWDDFVTRDALNGTFLHTRKFYDHNPQNRTDDHSFVFYKKNRIVGVVPANLVMINGRRILQSYLRATYGGFVVSRDCGLEEIAEMVSLLVKQAREAGTDEIIIRNPFRIFNENNCDESDYAMWYCGFSIKSRELEVAILLDDKAKVESRYSDSARRSISKGKKIIQVEESHDLETFWLILENNLRDKYGTKPTHDLAAINSLLQCVGTGRVKLFVAKLGEKVIAGILVFLVNDRALHAQYIASDIAYQEYRPLNVVIDHIIEYGCANKYRYFNLGTANEDGGRKINAGLFRFKEGFGGRGVLRETMHLILNNQESGK